MNSMTTMRMLLSTAALTAVAALFAGGANAVVQDEGGGASYNQPIVAGDFVHAALANRAAATTVQPGTIPYLSHGIGVDESQYATPTSPGFTGDSAVKVDRAVAAANEAYETYRAKTAIAARRALFTDQQPSVGLTGDSAVTRYPGTVTLPTASSASDGVDWSWFGLGAGMTALLAAGIAGVVLTTRRRGGIALP